MDKNKKYSEPDGENDDFTGQSNYDDRNGDGYDYDASDSDYEDLEDKW